MLWEAACFYFQIEIDEGGNRHEDDRERLLEIQTSMGRHRPGFVLRVNADGMLIKRQHSDGEVKYAATKDFDRRIQLIAAFIREHIVPHMINMTVPVQCRDDVTALHVEKLLF